MNEIETVRVLIEFIRVCNEGSVKPYDSATVLQNLSRTKGVAPEIIEKIMECCPPSAEIRDAKDFIPYRNAALKKIAEILDLDA